MVPPIRMGRALRVVSPLQRWLLLGASFAILATLIVALGSPLAQRAYLDEAETRAQTTLRLAVAALRGHLRRYEALPSVVADYPIIQAMVIDADNEALRQRGNAYLKRINALLNSSDIYVMLPNGETIAASNFDGDVSFVGENFSYRPYFTEAAEGRQGRFFALGTTSLKRGYYFSAPIRIGAEVRGVVVFKVDVDTIEATWAGGDSEIIVTDPEQIVFMTSRPEWLYSALEPLTPDRIERTQISRRYADADLADLPLRRARAVEDHQLIAIGEPRASQEFLVLNEPMDEAGWTVRVLLDTTSARTQALTLVAAALMVLGLATLAAAFILQRSARLEERTRLQSAAREQLEQRVEERTADLAAVNRQLETEVSERRATEQQLRQTQTDLVQAGKLAALGQMSAALSHEFNQPLAAVRNYADNAAVLIERGRVVEASDNIARISKLTERMASISKHLRNFARMPNRQLRAVPLEQVVADTMEVIAWRLKAADADIHIDLGPVPPVVRAGPVRLQQVLVNIISNAADAVEGLDDRRIDLTADTSGSQVLIAVRDRGPGVPDGIVGRVFDPFFSTKGVGKGLGLGLSISYNIVKDFGGNLSVARHPDGGAVFTIALDAAELTLSEAAE